MAFNNLGKTIDYLERRVGYLRQEKSIFKIDFSNLRDEKLIEHAIYTNVAVKKIQNDISFFIDLSNAKITFEAFQYILDASKQVQPYIQKSAVVGIRGFTNFLFKRYCSITGSKIKSFSETQEAMSYLSE